FGTSPENPDRVGLAIDGDTGTFWSTSTYVRGALGKSGVGLYVAAKPHVAANRAVVETAIPGFDAQIWGADHVAPYSYSPAARPGISPAALGWPLLGQAHVGAQIQQIALRRVRERRYYLLWITNLGPDPSGAGKAVQ